MYTRSLFSLPLAATALLATRAAAQTCDSYGVDFVNGGEYFINTNSNASFTCVTEFSGCTNSTADVLLVDPNGDEYECSDIPTYPDFTKFMSTCPIEKNQMFSGEWSILLLSNNGDADSFAVERDFSLSCGPQVTSTVTPTVSVYKTITPTVTATTTSSVTTTATVNNSKTVTVPASTMYHTVTPKPTTTTSVHLITRTIKSWTQTSTKVVVSVTPSCTIPPRQAQPDPVCRIVPKLIPLPPGISIPKRDAAVDVQSARKRFAAVRARRAAAAAEPRAIMAKRSADQPTVTSTLSTPVVTSTITVTGTTSTVPDVVLTTKTVTKTLPPATVHKGTAQSTVTAPTPVKTQFTVSTTSVTTTRTLTATLTITKVVAPPATITACKKQGGHFGGHWLGGGW